MTNGGEGEMDLPNGLAEQVAEEFGVDDISEVAQEIDLIYEEADEYSLFPVNFANVGGMHQGGGFKLDLYLEYLSQPTGQRRVQFKEGSRGGIGPITQQGESHIIREHKAGVILSPEQTARIGAAMVGSVFGVDTETILGIVKEQIKEQGIEPGNTTIEFDEDEEQE